MAGSPDREILTIDEAAALLGVSIKTFNKVLHTQSIPARKIGREWKFSRQALIEWIGSGRSDDFYHEGSAPESDDEPAPSVPAKPGGVRPEARRTSGWRLEFD
ncbi:MAG: helix-turn-helix domain-containing protein [Planctomycetota bacterium]